ncbi:hypothetical protein ARMGADRAFT_1026105 [Armillaria gallica]|uniref:Uncharacterized protein n=1 Tax=Armillaria gallica TaxID=47427 RepID=A0A2H3ELV9_ARMGA|nr:hypothetical protein ARMGADRAFT_1026105 [Armillaria gallica]
MTHTVLLGLVEPTYKIVEYLTDIKIVRSERKKLIKLHSCPSLLWCIRRVVDKEARKAGKMYDTLRICVLVPASKHARHLPILVNLDTRQAHCCFNKQASSSGNAVGLACTDTFILSVLALSHSLNYLLRRGGGANAQASSSLLHLVSRLDDILLHTPETSLSALAGSRTRHEGICDS